MKGVSAGHFLLAGRSSDKAGNLQFVIQVFCLRKEQIHFRFHRGNYEMFQNAFGNCRYVVLQLECSSSAETGVS
jgi:hypothetical protein